MGPQKATPAQDALRSHLKANRTRYPPALRLALALAAASFGAMLLLIGFAAATDRALLRELLAFVAITTVSGGQAAALVAFSADPPLSMGWVLAMTILNMAGTLYLVVPLAWRSLEGLRETRLMGGIIMGAEQFASRHRHALARGGVVALGVVATLPIQGAGVLGAGVLGVLLRVPLRRLLVVLTAVGIAVNVAWAFIIHATAQALPDGGWWDLLPLAVVVLIVVAGAVASRRGRALQREASIETFGWIDAKQRAELRAVGIKGTKDMLRVDLRSLARRIGIPDDALGRARNVAGLIRLNTIQPDEAVRLTEVGVTRIRDLAVTPPSMVHAALREAGAKDTAKEVRSWHDEAEAFLAETGHQHGDDRIDEGESRAA